MFVYLFDLLRRLTPIEEQRNFIRLECGGALQGEEVNYRIVLKVSERGHSPVRR